MLRLIKQFFNVTFKVEEEQLDDEVEEEDNEVEVGSTQGSDSEMDSDSDDEVLDLPKKVQLSCVGVGYSNMVRSMR